MKTTYEERKQLIKELSKRCLDCGCGSSESMHRCCYSEALSTIKNLPTEDWLATFIQAIVQRQLAKYHTNLITMHDCNYTVVNNQN